MGTAKPLPVSEVLRTAIDQYADPMAFVRELVQNAIDAGALAVDVEVDDAETDHLLEVRVRDDGAGMS
ncbi:MAG: ATP-binding protein, partial [Nannocystaceae bacterium]